MVKDYFKKTKDTHFTQLSNQETDFAETLESNTDIQKLLEKDFDFNRIQEAMEALDEMSADIIYMKFIQEMTNDEIANSLAMTNDNVRQRLSRAIKKLKKLL